MQYEDTVTGEVEIIWNSRDGVTPFCEVSKAGNESRHVRWGEDRYAPEHWRKLKPGDRIFVDLTLERARAYRRAYVERYWDQDINGFRMSARWDSPDLAIEELAQADMERPGQPDLLTVDASFLAGLKVAMASPPRPARLRFA